MHSRILEAVAQLSGEILHVPSAVSAIKVNGVRSYARVRSGEQVELAARPVTISEFTVHSINPGFAEYVIEDPENEGEHAATSVPVIDCKVTVSCSSGTYIRALARDLGKILGTGGHLTAPRRTRVGAVVLEDAADLAQLKRRREESEAPLEDLPQASPGGGGTPQSLVRVSSLPRRQAIFPTVVVLAPAVTVPW